jgi:hypothetical protein
MINKLRPAKLVVTLTVVTPDESYSSAETFFKSLNLDESKGIVKKIKELLGNEEEEVGEEYLDNYDDEPEFSLMFKNNSESFDI